MRNQKYWSELDKKNEFDKKNVAGEMAQSSLKKINKLAYDNNNHTEYVESKFLKLNENKNQRHIQGNVHTWDSIKSA